MHRSRDGRNSFGDQTLDDSIKPEMERLDLEKRRAEIAKLQAETVDIARPWWRRPNYWISIVPIVVASVTLGQLIATGYYDGLRREIKIQKDSAEQAGVRLDFENKKLAREQANLEARQKALQGEIDDLQKKRGELTSQAQAASVLATAGVEVKYRGGGVDVRFANYDTEIDLTSLVRELRQLKNVQWLSFTNTDLDDTQLMIVSECETITDLWLDATKVTSDGIAPLERLKGLKVLSANSTKLDDKARAHFAKMPQLKTLQLVGTKITPSGVKLIKELLPGCDVQASTQD
jgi:hypothetical protein